MSQPTIDSVAPGGVVNLSDAPGGLDDSTFDSLFPAEPAPIVAAVTSPAATVVPATTEPVQPAAPYLKGATSTYNSPEAAVEGINQKDALISQLRQRYALTTGIDPITGQPVLSPNPTPQGVDYSQSPDKYLADLYEAGKAGNAQAYRDVQTKLILDTVKPLQPVMQRAAREQAVEAVSQEIKEAGPYIGTAAYHATLDATPELKEAIHTAENDYRFHSKLPGLYKIAYLSGQGRALPDILKANAAQIHSTQNPPAQPRTTVQQTTPSAPQVAQRPSFRTIEGIRATIAQAEANGAKLDF